MLTSALYNRFDQGTAAFARFHHLYSRNYFAVRINESWLPILDSDYWKFELKRTYSTSFWYPLKDREYSKYILYVTSTNRVVFKRIIACDFLEQNYSKEHVIFYISLSYFNIRFKIIYNSYFLLFNYLFSYFCFPP